MRNYFYYTELVSPPSPGLNCRPLAGVFCLILLAFTSVAFSHAQTAALMDDALESRELSAAQAAYFVLTAAELIPPDAGIAAAFTQARSDKWLRNNKADSPISMGELSYLIMRAFKLKGSVFYRLFPGPRYAYRELVYRRLIPPPNDPAGRVTGREFFQVLGNVLRTSGEEAVLERAARQRRLGGLVESPQEDTPQEDIGQTEDLGAGQAEDLDAGQPEGLRVGQPEGIRVGTEDVLGYNEAFEVE
ncbi:hypothetical protein LQZ19_17835 [Treponema primitia]|uniref:hypothetical protein n=1 Tax=Treponema primitia TaxID=88058 RepID=UPI00397F57AB